MNSTSSLDFSDLLDVLGHGSDPGDHTSINYQGQGGPFRTKVVGSEQAPRHAAAIARGHDLWFGVNPLVPPTEFINGSKSRGAEADVRRLAALYVDLDVKPEGLRDAEAVNRVVIGLTKALGAMPAAIVESGSLGGKHLYWPLADGAENTISGSEAKALLRRFGRLAIRLAQAEGGSVDSVFDLARVLRIPGTLNHKSDPAREVIGHVVDGWLPLTVAEIRTALDEAGIAEIDGDGDIGDRAIVSAPEVWRFAEPDEGSCAYVAAMLGEWPTDAPKGGQRHRTIIAKATRLAAFWRAGCITEADYHRGGRILSEWLSRHREATSDEVTNAMHDGVGIIAGKTDDELLSELGHDPSHPLGREGGEHLTLIGAKPRLTLLNGGNQGGSAPALNLVDDVYDDATEALQEAIEERDAQTQQAVDLERVAEGQSEVGDDGPELVDGWTKVQVERLAELGLTPQIVQQYSAQPVLNADDLNTTTAYNAPQSWMTYLPAMVIGWPMDGEISEQIWPDDPHGQAFAEDYRPELWTIAGDLDTAERVVIVEGAFNAIAVAAAVGDGVAVLAIPDARRWFVDGAVSLDLSALYNSEVAVWLDDSYQKYRGVWDAAEALQGALMDESARVTWVQNTVWGAARFLAGRPADRRGLTVLARIREAKAEKFPASRRPRLTVEEGGSPYFGETGLLADKLAKAVADRCSIALTRERQIAVYTADGVYQVDHDDLALKKIVFSLLGDTYRRDHFSTVKDALTSTYAKPLPERVREPLVNVINGMLDLRTGELLPHSPEYRSSRQLPIEWDPTAECPEFDAWAAERCGDQLDDLEESTSVMLDQSRTPSRAVFLFGPPRSGKSTWLRLMEAIVGHENVSAVTLKELNEDKFASANLYNAMLNTSGDLAASHIEDLSVFKRMTGEDLIQANRKYGSQFSFRSTALFAFSANALPTVGDLSGAYADRIKPFEFPNSFSGAEDPQVEDRLMNELPGILRRWVAAWQRFAARRGGYRPTDPEIKRRFVESSNRVALFVREACELVEASPGQTVKQASTPTQLHRAFTDWADEAGGRGMGRNRLKAALLALPDVYEVRFGANYQHGLNLVIKPRSQWDDPGSTVVFRSVDDQAQKHQDRESSATDDDAEDTSSGSESKTTYDPDTFSDGLKTVLETESSDDIPSQTPESIDLDALGSSYPVTWLRLESKVFVSRGETEGVFLPTVARSGAQESVSVDLSRTYWPDSPRTDDTGEGFRPGWSPAWHVATRAARPMAQACEECGTELKPFDTTGLFQDCPTCYPDTFEE